MGEDQIVGAGRTELGEAERNIGGAIADERLEREGVFNKLAGGVQESLGTAKDAVSEVIGAVPAAVDGLVDRSRELLHDGDAAVRRKLGDNGPLYVLAAAAGFLGIALFAVARTSHPAPPKRKPRAATRTRAATPKEG